MCTSVHQQPDVSSLLVVEKRRLRSNHRRVVPRLRSGNCSLWAARRLVDNRGGTDDNRHSCNHHKERETVVSVWWCNIRLRRPLRHPTSSYSQTRFSTRRSGGSRIRTDEFAMAVRNSGMSCRRPRPVKRGSSAAPRTRCDWQCTRNTVVRMHLARPAQAQ